MYVTFQKRTRSIVDKVGGWIFTRKRYAMVGKQKVMLLLLLPSSLMWWLVVKVIDFDRREEVIKMWGSEAEASKEERKLTDDIPVEGHGNCINILCTKLIANNHIRT